MAKQKAEILAPAGSAEGIRAAVRAGADAVYFGTGRFNARIKAGGFSDSELTEALDYCHSHAVKAHITLNTLVKDSELEAALEELGKVYTAGADALIIQDIGIARLARKYAPHIERHASTQMSVQTVSGVRLLEELGFSRVVLPRECTRQEIEKITSQTRLETEVFVHGALCMSVSGQCYMSSLFGGRSGNRGLCAQPCRLPFAASSGTGYDLSLKDLSLISKAPELREMGVASFKIEGRLKRPEYAAAAVSCLKATLEGRDTALMTERLQAVFSRSGFTQLYYENRRGREMFGIRKKEDVTAATEGVLRELASIYEKEQPLLPVNFYLTVIENENISLSLTCRGISCFVSEPVIPERAVNKPLTEEGLRQRIGKCGGTQFYADKIEIELDEGLIVPASAINGLRRKALEELENKLKTVKHFTFTPDKLKIPCVEKNRELKFNVRVADVSQIPEKLENVENLYVPLNVEENLVESLKNLPVSVGIEVPRGIFGNEEAVKRRLSRLKECGISVAYCGTLDGLAIARELGFELHTGFTMNVFNSVSARTLEELGVKSLTLSPELTLREAAGVYTGVKRGLIGYGRLPLMLTRNCPVGNGKSCEQCKGNSFLTDRLGKKFPVVCTLGCSELLNSQPLYMGDRIDEIGNMDFITFYFTKEKREVCDRVLEAYRKRQAVKGEYTRGLYYRGLSE